MRIRIEKIIPAPILATKYFLEVLALLDQGNVQYQGNIMMQPWKNSKNSNFRCLKFFSWVLPLLVVRQCSKQFPGKLKNQTWKMTKKPNFGPDFDTFGLFAPNLAPKPFLWVLPLLHVTYCCKLSLYPISRKTNEPNLKK